MFKTRKSGYIYYAGNIMLSGNKTVESCYSLTVRENGKESPSYFLTEKGSRTNEKLSKEK
jgi:hypothetical protein